MEYYHSELIMMKAVEVEEERRMFIVFNALNGELKKDGNQWCAITGTMPESYLAGFADTPAAAMLKWYQEYFSNNANLTPKPQ